MKMLRLLLSWCLLDCGVSVGQTVDPFAPQAAPNRSNRERVWPIHIQVQVEWIEVAQEELTRLMAKVPATTNTTELRKELAEMVVSDKAAVMETMLLVGRTGEKSSAESGGQKIYPAEYEPPGHVEFELSPEMVRREQNWNSLNLPVNHSSFEWRATGSMLEIACNLSSDSKTVDVNLDPQMVSLAGYAIHEEFVTLDGSLHQEKRPIFAMHYPRVSTTCRSGQYHLVAALTPLGKDGQLDRGRKLLVLVKCDVMLVK